MFQYDSIQKHLSSNYQSVMRQLQNEWPKIAKEYIYKVDQRINEQVASDNQPNDIDIDIGSSKLAPDLQRRLKLRYENFNFSHSQLIHSQNSQNVRALTIHEEIQIYENELGTAFLTCKLILFYHYYILI